MAHGAWSLHPWRSHGARAPPRDHQLPHATHPPLEALLLLLLCCSGIERGAYVQMNAKSKQGEGWGADLAAKMSGERGATLHYSSTSRPT